MRRRSIAALLVAILFSAAAAYGQKPPQNELGFHPDKLYQFGELDSVNLFNGNLIIRIPIGHAFPVNSHLSDALTLVYNGNLWEYEKVSGVSGDSTDYYHAHPNRRSNAGIGWRISMGRLIEPFDTTAFNSYDDPYAWVYESPAGDEHRFVTGDPNNVMVSGDDSALRMLKTSTGRQVQFPDGTFQTFEKEYGRWRLKRIDDRFGNYIKISYAIDPMTQVDTSWTVQDYVASDLTAPLRTSFDISFIHKTAMNDTIDDGQVVSSIFVTKPGGGTPLQYTFDYNEAQDLPWGCNQRLTPLEVINHSVPDYSNAPRLSRINLPDGTSFSFTYYTGQQGDCSTGELHEMTLPTGGVASYSYTPYSHPSDFCAPPAPNSIVPGVATKTYMGGTWTYIHTLGPDYPDTPPDWQINNPCGQGPDVSGMIPPKRWARTSVISPPRRTDSSNAALTTYTRTDNYFNVWVAPSAVPDPWGAQNIGYGLAVTTGGPAANVVGPPTAETADVDTRVADGSAYVYLSTRTFDGCTASGDCSGSAAPLMRSAYLRYRNGDFPAPAIDAPNAHGQIVEASRTVFNDDGGTYTQETYSNLNGVGRFRQVDHTTNFANGAAYSTFTNYPTWLSSDWLSLSRSWILNTYTEQKRTENGVSARTLTCFDAAGFLVRSRVLAGSVPGNHDVVTIFDYSEGNVTDQAEYGGDAQDVGAPTESSVCTAALPSAPKYRTLSTWKYGALETSKIADPANAASVLLMSTDRTIDQPSGYVTDARDASGIATHYGYDSLGRLSSVSAPGSATLTYAYTNAGTGTNAKVTATTAASSGSFQRVVEFDAFGRMIHDSRQTGPSEWIVQEAAYDPWSRKVTDSVPVALAAPPSGSIGAPSSLTIYDAFGRVRYAKAPDAYTTVFAYSGTQTVSRTVNIAMPPYGDQNPATTTETYDSQGRLKKVTEPSGPTNASAPTGAPVTTAYGYDVGGRLTSVSMAPAEGGSPQTRSFSYDGRGFLASESSPEGGTIDYSMFDPRGHAAYKSLRAATVPTFNLKLTYDAAERLTNVDQATFVAVPAESASFRVFKQFSYGSSNGTIAGGQSDYTQGKLTLAKRWNYTPAGSYLVSEAYHYADNAGRRTHKTTTISVVNGSDIRVIDQSVTYDNLGLRTMINYPTCGSCASATQNSISPTYSYGRLASIPGYLNSITYAPTGMPATMTHSNGIVDTHAADPFGMARPRSIKFEAWSSCTAPSLTGPYDNTYVSGSAMTLSVIASGTAPFTYQWYRSTNGGATFTAISGATGSSLTEVPPNNPTEYRVDVTNNCRTVSSRAAHVTLTGTAPTITVQPADTFVNGAGQATFSVAATGTATLHYQWFRGTVPDQSNPVGADSASFTTPALTVTTRYWVKVSNGSGQVSSDTARAFVALPAPALLTATRSGTTGTIAVTWSASANAAYYEIYERRLNDGDFFFADRVPASSTTWQDTLFSGAMAIYKVRAIDAEYQSGSAWSPSDIASTIDFTPVTGTVVQLTHFTELLQTLNTLRALAGQFGVSWQQILPANDTVPAVGVAVEAAHVTSLRNAINNVLTTLGVPTASTPAVSTGSVIQDDDIIALQGKFK